MVGKMKIPVHGKIEDKKILTEMGSNGTDPGIEFPDTRQKEHDRVS